MDQQVEAAEIDRLEAVGALVPGSPGFAALAEAHRRGGAADQALRVADAGLRARPDLVAGRLARALALLDLGRAEEARGEIVGVLQAVPDHPIAVDLLAPASEPPAQAAPFGDLGEGELEAAFLDAEAEPDQMVDANDVAQAALHQVEQSDAEDLLASADSPFATETVARLLEEQGHQDRAEAVRQGLVTDEPTAEAAPIAGRDAGVVATLERWLSKLQGGSR